MTSRSCAQIVLVLAIACCPWVDAQERPEPPQQLPPTAPVPSVPEVAQISSVAPCLQPPPVVRWQDYEGPFKTLVGVVGRRLERNTVTPGTHYKPGTVFCSLTLKGKFIRFAENSTDPIAFLTAAFDAGIDQAEDTTPQYGQDAAGYAKRFGANLADQASGAFFTGVVYSEIFREDPRYYRLGFGGVKRRFFHAVEHAVVARREDGRNGFNFSEWLGTASAVTLSYTYRPRTDTGVGITTERVVMGVAQDAGWDVLREFWPEIARGLKLPFREEPQPHQGISTPVTASGPH